MTINTIIVLLHSNSQSISAFKKISRRHDNAVKNDSKMHIKQTQYY